MKAVVMAGGAGSRLRPITIERPKPMITVVNKPVIGHILSLLKRHGITDVIITLQYMPNMVQGYFGDGTNLGMNINYFIENDPLGTAGGVKNVQNLIDDTFLVVMGDALADFDLHKIVDFHRRQKAKATITLHRVSNPLEFGVIITNSDGYVSQFLEKPSWSEVFSDTVNTGFYVLEPEILDWIPENEPYDFSHQLFPELMAANIPIAGYVADGYWCDIGNISTLHQATTDLLEGRAPHIELGTHIGGNVWVGGDVEIAPTATLLGPIYLGNSVKIKDHVVIHGPTVIRDYSVIDERTQIDRSIIWRNCYIGKGVELRGAMILRHCTLKAKSVVYEEAVIGDGTIVEEGAIIHPNVKIWSGKNIEPGAIVKSSVIWGSQGRRVLFGRQGVSGMVNVDLTPEFSAKLASSFGAILPKGSSVVINRDINRGSRMLKRAAISGLPSAGIHVVDLGVQPIPVARYFTRVSNAAASINFRLSPFDERVVNINFMDEQGLNINKDTERKIERIFFREDFRRVYTNEIGIIHYAKDAEETYLAGFLKRIDLNIIRQANYHLILDYAGGSTATFLPQLLTQLGCNAVALNANQDEDALSISHRELQEALQRLQLITKVLEATLGVRIDVAGEQIFVVDNLGRSVDGIKFAAAMADLALSTNPGKSIAISADLPHIFEQIAGRYDSKVIRTKVDPQALMEASLAENIVMAADGRGSFIFPDFQSSVDAMMTVAKLLQFLAVQQEKLSNVIDNLPRYYLAQSQVNCLWEAKGALMRKLSQEFENQAVNAIDGLKVMLDKRDWVLFLPSPDQPFINIVVEAKSQLKADRRLNEYTQLVRRLQPEAA